MFDRVFVLMANIGVMKNTLIIIESYFWFSFLFNLFKIIFLYLFYFYIYPPDSQESDGGDGGANT